MTRWHYILFYIILAVLYPFNSIAFDIPYGVQDPMRSPGFPMCDGGEIGYWQFLVRPDTNGKFDSARLVLTTVDILDPAFVICYVPADRRVLVMEPGKKL